DRLAVGVLQAFAFRHQVAVPEEIALAGYDNIAFARSTAVPLTSVAQPADLKGRTALARLEEEIAYASAPRPHATCRRRPPARAPPAATSASGPAWSSASRRWGETRVDCARGLCTWGARGLSGRCAWAVHMGCWWAAGERPARRYRGGAACGARGMRRAAC